MMTMLLAAAVFAVLGLALYVSQTGVSFRNRTAPPVGDAEPEPTSYFAIALVVRIGAAVVIRLSGMVDFFAPDRIGYEGVGQSLAFFWMGEVADVWNPQYHNFYHYLNGVSFFLSGTFWPIQILNCVIGAWVPALVASITRRVGGDERAVRIAALSAVLMPSLIIWSAVNIRDVWVLAAILFAIDSAFAIRERMSPASFAMFAMAMAIVGVLRSYMFVLLSVAVALSVIANLSLNRVRGMIAALLTAGLCAYLYSATGFGQQWVAEASLERVAEIRAGMVQGASSAYLADADVSTATGALRFLPFGLLYFWLAPFPWAATNFRQLVALPETLLMYWYLPHAIIGARLAVKHHFAQVALLVAVILIVSVAYALVEGNFGTAYRHRAQVLGPVLALAGVGISVSRRRSNFTPGVGIRQA